MVAKPPERGSRGGKTGREGGEKVSPTLLPSQPPPQHNSAGWLWGGRLGDVLAVAPINQPILSELQAFLGVSL